MKKALVILTTLLTLSSAAEARYFQMGAQCYVDSSIGECSAYNDSNRVMYCRGRIYGETSYGYTFKGRQQGRVYPGQSFYLYVRANNPHRDPLVDTWGEIECRF